MIAISTRKITPEERKLVTKAKPSLYRRIESFFMTMGFIVLMLVIPLLIYDHFRPVSSGTQAVYCIFIVTLALFISIWIFRGRLGYQKKRRSDPEEVEVIRVQTTRAVRREDPEDFGVAFYIDVMDMGRQKVLYLWGQYLDILEYEKEFPNTEFEIVRFAGRDSFIDFALLGVHFPEE
ncbi:MAG TPA: hypothetical protein VKQ52_11965, partial [Puia sp.]|nr:hypothetical protein [Puia sp.]